MNVACERLLHLTKMEGGQAAHGDVEVCTHGDGCEEWRRRRREREEL